jgi:hypothetical protein
MFHWDGIETYLWLFLILPLLLQFIKGVAVVKRDPKSKCGFSIKWTPFMSIVYLINFAQIDQEDDDDMRQTTAESKITMVLFEDLP